MVDITVFVGNDCVTVVAAAVVVVVVAAAVAVVVVVVVILVVALLVDAPLDTLDSQVRTLESFSTHNFFVSFCPSDDLDFLL